MTDTTAPETSALRRAVIHLSRRLRQERGDAGLSANKLGILAHLYRRGPATPGEIAVAERQQPQSLTRIFADLESAGLVLRRRDDVDRRQSVLEITDQGRKTIEEDMKRRDLWLNDALSRLNETEREVLRLAASLMERLTNMP